MRGRLWGWSLFGVGALLWVVVVIVSDLQFWLNLPLALPIGGITWFLGSLVGAIVHRERLAPWRVVLAFVFLFSSFLVALWISGLIVPLADALTPYDTVINALAVLSLATITLYYAVLTERMSEATVAQARLLQSERDDRATPRLLLVQDKPHADDAFRLVNFGEVAVQIAGLDVTDEWGTRRPLNRRRPLLRPSEDMAVHVFSEPTEFWASVQSGTRDRLDNQIGNEAELEVEYMSSSTGQRVHRDTFSLTVWPDEDDFSGDRFDTISISKTTRLGTDTAKH